MEKQSKKYKALHGARFRIFFPIAIVSQINISLGRGVLSLQFDRGETAVEMV